MELQSFDDFTILWLTIYGEARGETVDGQIAVGSVIKNRCFSRKQTWKEVCLAPQQFSCWNLQDPNRALLESIIEKNMSNPWIEQTKFIASGIMNNKLLDNTLESNCYLTISLYQMNPPNWAKKGREMIKIGNHVFLRA